METIIRHIRTALDCYNGEDYKSALLHATIAVEISSRRWKSVNKSTRSIYKDFIRHYDWLIERFGGISPLSIRTQLMVEITNEHGNKIGDPNPDLADIIYHIFRCDSCHGNEIPVNYEFVTSDSPRITITSVESAPSADAVVSLPSGIIIGLLSACVFNKGSTGISSEDDYFLSYNSSVAIDAVYEKIEEEHYITVITGPDNITFFPIKNWWGREDDIKSFLATQHIEKGITKCLPLNKGEKVNFRRFVKSGL